MNKKNDDVPKIEPERMKPERDAGKWDDGDFWVSERARQVLNDLKWLNHGNRELRGSQRFWTAEEADPLDHFWMQSYVLILTVRLVPSSVGDPAVAEPR